MPVWRMTIDVSDVFHNEAMTFDQRRDAIVTRLRRSSWTGLLVTELFDELAETETPDDFDDVWNAIYDEADVDRVWIRTRPKPQVASR